MSKNDGSITPRLVGENSLIGSQRAKEITGYTKPTFTFTNPLLKMGADLGILSNPFSFSKNQEEEKLGEVIRKDDGSFDHALA